MQDNRHAGGNSKIAFEPWTQSSRRIFKKQLIMRKANNIDKDLRQLMHDRLPDAPVDPWFIRKVMNRLPDKPVRRKKSLAEVLCYIFGILGIFAAWGYSLHTTLTEGLTVQTVVTAAILMLLTLFCIGIFAFPALRRSL